MVAEWCRDHTPAYIFIYVYLLINDRMWTKNALKQRQQTNKNRENQNVFNT